MLARAAVFFTLSKILDLFLAPLTWAALLVFFAVVVRDRRRSRALGIAGLFVLLVFSLEPVSNSLLRALEAEPSARPAPSSYDAIILLGGLLEARVTSESGMRSYNESVERLLVTRELLAADVAPMVIISGGPGDPPEPVVEAEELRDALVELGIANDRIHVEGRSRNTRENALESEKIIRARGYRRVLLITSAAHMPRALEEFARLGIEASPYPVDFRAHAHLGDAPRWTPRSPYLDDSTRALRELAGRLIYRLSR